MCGHFVRLATSAKASHTCTILSHKSNTLSILNVAQGEDTKEEVKAEDCKRSMQTTHQHSA
jgi:hypothetical protein